MFHLVFSGPEQATDNVLADLSAAGYPAQIAHQHGFTGDPLVGWVEALGDPSLVDDAARIARAHGWTLRLHGPIASPELIPLVDRLEARIDDLEARIAALTEGAR